MPFEIIKVDNLQSRRFEVGLELLADGGGFCFENVQFTIRNSRLCCDAYSRREPDCLTEAIARQTLAAAEATYQHVLDESAAFRELAQQLTVRYSLIYDYGKGSVELCYLDGSELHWKWRS